MQLTGIYSKIVVAASALTISVFNAVASMDLSTHIPLLDGDAQQQQFVSGLNNVFSGHSTGRFGWGQSSTQIAIVFGAGMLVAAILAGLFYLMRSFRKKEISREQMETLFVDKMDRADLSADERGVVERMLSHVRVMEPHAIFQSLQLFEQCVDADVNYLLKNGDSGDPDGREGKLLSAIRNKLGYSHLSLEHPLLSTRNISIGQSGSLFGKDASKPIFRHVSVVDNNSFFFTIKYNVENEEVFHLARGTLVRFVFARQADGLYGVQVPVTDIGIPGTLTLAHTLDVKRNQLRQHVRMETNLPLRIRLISTKDPETSEVKRGEMVTTKMLDISGGGLSFTYDKSLRLNDIVSMNFDVPGSAFAGVTGRIVHLTLREGKGLAMYKHHVQFVDIEPHKRELIIKYVFEKERHINQWR